MSEFFTWQTLATYAGATSATAVFTQLFKGVGFIKFTAGVLTKQNVISVF